MHKRLFTDTTNFVSIDYGDIICLREKQFAVKGHEHEGRNGLEDPKLWVKRAVDSETGEKKILKLSFFESFDITLGGAQIKRFRNPDKEGDILDIVKDHPYFMQGTTCRDERGNNIRIIDIIRGPSFFVYIDTLSMDHETYFHTALPSILKRLVSAFEAIRFLHLNGFRHGDIRNDHIMVEKDTGKFRWIDFDYDYETSENPFGLDIFGLGNILTYAVGMGFHTFHSIRKDAFLYGNLIDRLDSDDFSILKKGRLMNLKKLYPYIPNSINNILMHFSVGSDVYYEHADELIEDLQQCLFSLQLTA
jgi:hypothetical protein